jgi:hypothetical protein
MAAFLILNVEQCETWCLKNRQAVFENRVLRRIGLKRGEMVGGWKKLHNEGLHNLCFLPNIIKIDEV